MRLTIIIPVYNEERSIKEILHKVFTAPILCEKEVIVINDGSSDDTVNLLKISLKKYNFKLLQHNKNLGKGAAIKTGLVESTGGLIIIQDGDLEYDPKDIPKLLSKMDEDISVVAGNRDSKKYPKRGYHYVLGAKILTSTVNFLYGTKLTDLYTGYKIFNKNKIGNDVFKNINSQGFEFEAEIICKILNEGGKIIETQISYTPRSKAEGKHIGLKDAFKGFFTILRFYKCAQLESNQRPYP